MQIGARGRDGGIDEFILATMRISLLAKYLDRNFATKFEPFSIS